MLRTYRALLRGHMLQWLQDRPKDVPSDQAVPVHVTILDDSVLPEMKEEQGRRMAAALEAIACTPTTSWPADPRAWQHEIREDRPLPGRDDYAD
jgi:hypothetical protein